MADRTGIEWTDATWNPVHGCSKVSPGCAHCYAETLSRRYGHTPAPWTPANADENVLLKPHKLGEPLRWKTPRRVFVNSMSDLFHEAVPDDFIRQVFATMAAAQQHTFQVLTKRPERMYDLLGGWYRVPGQSPDRPLPNVWLGVSIENRRYVHRADLLRATPAAVRFISAEPLLGPLVPHVRNIARGRHGWNLNGGRGVELHDDGLDLAGIDWLIVGGESGPGHRPIHEQWVRDLRDAAAAAGTAFFFKQWGGARPGGDALLDGVQHRAFPATTEVPA